MPKRDFTEALRQADQALATSGMPDAVDLRLRRRINAHLGAPAPRLHAWQLGLGLAVALGLAVLILLPRRSERGAPAVAAEQMIALEPGGAPFADPSQGLTIVAAVPAQLRRAGGGLELLSGQLEVRIDARPERRAELGLGEGTISARSARLQVARAHDEISVEVLEGSVHFRSRSGVERELGAGQSLRWPPVPVPVPVPAATPPTPAVAAPHKAQAPVDVDALVEEIAMLRSRGEYATAAGKLERALSHPLRHGARERLDYELGSLLGHQLGQVERACALWAKHLAAYPGGRYEREVHAQQVELGCK